MKIRTAGPADADEIVHVKNASWRAAYSGLIDDNVLAGLSDEPSEAFVMNLSSPPPFWLTLVAERGPDVIGSVTVGRDTRESTKDETSPGSPGEVWMLYVHPDRWGKGVGRALMREAHKALNEFALSPIRVWVLDSNEVGLRFYEQYGFVRDGERSTHEMNGSDYPIVRLTLPKERVVDELA
ncbi:GNAT family N-acetyltransferase [Glycomyces sp. L485]|uniref:GNAT family N-acetyltransferase n=1 Tax=Glycomyces sp. L485 TaxID=2909235 RepID=UPI001F4B0D52|nr:GNAT family N-acetyltransferase [Glycomyces sp. L485]MCH7229567.1 GNAT family N-acetyltransferase [Glycomyces sp. L485]